MKTNFWIIQLLVWAVYLLPKPAIAQPISSVKGQVLEKSTQHPLAGVTVRIYPYDHSGEAPTQGATTDAEGYFRIASVPVGRYTASANYLGYKDQSAVGVIVSAGKDLVLRLEMEENTTDLAEVAIEAPKEKQNPLNGFAAVSARSFSVEEANRFAGALSDPSRMVSAYAGVVGADDQRNDIVVRGNSPAGLLWRLEGIDIPNPNHLSFVGTSGGFLCALNNNLLANSDFLTGAFPAAYGNRNAAAFDIRLRNGNFDKTEYTAQIGLNGLEFGAEGPLKWLPNSSYVASYRFLSPVSLKKLGVNLHINGLPNTQDLNFKVHLPTRKFGQFTLFGVGGLSSIQLLESERDPDDWSFSDKAEDLTFSSGMGAGGLMHTYFLGSKTVGKAWIAVTGSRNAALREFVYEGLPKKLKEDLRIDENHLIAKYELMHKANRRTQGKAGVTLTRFFYDFFQKEINNNGGYGIHFDEKGRTDLLQAYVQWQYKYGERWLFNGGLYHQWLRLNGSRSLEPRISAQFSPGNNQHLSLGLGMHSQMQPLIFYSRNYRHGDTVEQTNRELDFTRSLHVVLGYDLQIKPQLRCKVEAYYQKHQGVPVSPREFGYYSGLNAGAEYSFWVPDSLQNTGTGENYGLELTTERFFHRGFYYLSTLSLFSSHFRGADGVKRNTVFNNQYAYNLLGGYEWKTGRFGKDALSIDLRLSMSGGKPYVPIDLDASIAAGKTVWDTEHAYEQRLGDFQRVDVKFSYRLNREKANHVVFIGANNLLHRKNELSIKYNAEKQELVKEYQLGLFPVAGYRVQF